MMGQRAVWRSVAVLLLQVNLFPFQETFSVLSLGALGSKGCAPGWVLFETSCYKLNETNVTWSQARRECEAEGSHLVTFGSAEENDFVYKTLAKGKSLWIGLYRNPVDFYWVTKEDLVYQNWIRSEGNNINEKCVEMTDYGTFHGQWNDKPCDHKQGYICEDQHQEGIFELKRGVSLYGHAINEPISLSTSMGCVLKCLQKVDCKSVNFHSSVTPPVCQLNNARMKEFPEDVIKEEDAAYYEKLAL